MIHQQLPDAILRIDIDNYPVKFPLVQKIHRKTCYSN